MSWFFKPKRDAKPLGVDLGGKNGIKAEIEKMQGTIKKTSRTYQNDIKKYKEVAKLNEHLTKSYVANLKVIVDVSELLNSYTGVFNSMKEEFSKMETAAGRPLELSDFNYLENLTKSKMEDLNSEFSKQAVGLRRLYAEYGKPEELNRVLVAQGDIAKTVEDATEVYKTIKSSKSNSNASLSLTPSQNASTSTNATVSQQGGMKKKSHKKVVKKTVKSKPQKK